MLAGWSGIKMKLTKFLQTPFNWKSLEEIFPEREFTSMSLFARENFPLMSLNSNGFFFSMKLRLRRSMLPDACTLYRFAALDRGRSFTFPANEIFNEIIPDK